MAQYKYLDVMTVRSSAAAGSQSIDSGTICNAFCVSEAVYFDLGKHLQLLVEPVVVPENMSQYDIHGTEKTLESETRYFYPTGKKNINMRQVIEKTTRDAQRGPSGPGNPKKRQARGYASIIPQQSKPTTELPPKPKDKLFYGKKPDLKTENLLNTLRFNEAKIVGVISTKT